MMISRDKLIKQFVTESGWSPAEAPKFADWYLMVDHLVAKKIGVGIHDIGDWGYADAFEDGRTPASAAKEVAALFNRGEL